MKSQRRDWTSNPPPIRLRSGRRSGTALISIGSTALVLAGLFLIVRQSGLHLDDVISSLSSSPVEVRPSVSVEPPAPMAPAVLVSRSKSVEPTPVLAPATEQPTGTVVPATVPAPTGLGDPPPASGRSDPGLSLALQPTADAPRGASIAALPLQLTPSALTAPPAAARDAAAPSAPAPEAVLQGDPPAEKLTPAAAESMARRAADMIKLGDIAAARVLLERPARDGYAPAIFALAETYDPRVLTQWGIRRPRGDMAQARVLYGEALKGGVTEARDRLGESDRSATKALVLGQP